MDFFAKKLINWQKKEGRHDLPWQNTTDAYRIWVSEIMLQQTQVTTVIPYYLHFLEDFPTVTDLANAPLENVMRHWSGLGFYSRARNLHKTAQKVNGKFPTDSKSLEKLPGIGRSTAAAIAVFSSGEKAAILDGNVVRVLSRVFEIKDDVKETKTQKKFWKLAESLLPDHDIQAYTQGLMDLGATVCTSKYIKCRLCPFVSECKAYQHGTQEQLPFKKKAKKLPEKAVFMPIIVANNKVLLERRKSLGIWGGLWSLPEFSTEEEMADFVQNMGSVVKRKAINRIKHKFSHYQLLIHPMLYHIQNEPEGLWVALKEVTKEPLATPIKTLLVKVAQHYVD